MSRQHRFTNREFVFCVVPGCYVPSRHVENGDDPCTDQNCTGCLPGLAADQSLVCLHHHRRAKFRLAEMPVLYDALCDGMVRRTAMVSEFVDVSGDTGLVLDDNVIEAKEQILARMSNLCWFICKERGFSPPENYDVRTMGRYLAVNADWMSRNEVMAPIWGRQLDNIARDVRKVAYRSKPTGVFLGTCPQIVDGLACGARLWHDPSGYDGTDVVCRKCGKSAAVDWWRDELTTNLEGVTLLTSGALVPILAWETKHPISDAQIRQWAHRGFIQRHGKDPQGRTLYNRTAVLAYATDQTREHTDDADAMPA